MKLKDLIEGDGLSLSNIYYFLRSPRDVNLDEFASLLFFMFPNEGQALLRIIRDEEDEIEKAIQLGIVSSRSEYRKQQVRVSSWFNIEGSSYKFAVISKGKKTNDIILKLNK